MFVFLLLASAASAEFLTPVPDHDASMLPDLCLEETVVSCTLVTLDPACLTDSTLVFNGVTLTALDKPGNDTFTFSSEKADEAIFTVDNELGAVWGNVRLDDGSDFLIEPALDICAGCHVVIDEDRAAFPEDHKVEHDQT